MATPPAFTAQKALMPVWIGGPFYPRKPPEYASIGHLATVSIGIHFYLEVRDSEKSGQVGYSEQAKVSS